MFFSSQKIVTQEMTVPFKIERVYQTCMKTSMFVEIVPILNIRCHVSPIWQFDYDENPSLEVLTFFLHEATKTACWETD